MAFICKERKFDVVGMEIVGTNISDLELSKYNKPIRAVYHHLRDKHGREAVRRSEVRRSEVLIKSDSFFFFLQNLVEK